MFRNVIECGEGFQLNSQNLFYWFFISTLLLPISTISTLLNHMQFPPTWVAPLDLNMHCFLYWLIPIHPSSLRLYLTSNKKPSPGQVPLSNVPPGTRTTEPMCCTPVAYTPVLHNHESPPRAATERKLMQSDGGQYSQ